MSDSAFTWMITWIILGAMLVVVGAKSCDEMTCSPERKGRMRMVGEYAGIVEICNGSEWVPAKGEVPK